MIGRGDRERQRWTGQRRAGCLSREKSRDVGRNYLAVEPQASDEFNSWRLGLQWQWEGNPNAEWMSLEERPGWLRLYSQRLPDAGTEFMECAEFVAAETAGAGVHRHHED